MAVALKAKRSKSKIKTKDVISDDIPDVPVLEDFLGSNPWDLHSSDCSTKVTAPAQNGSALPQNSITEDSTVSPVIEENEQAEEDIAIEVGCVPDEMIVIAPVPTAMPLPQDANIPSPYLQLISDVHQCLEEISAPTAPVLEICTTENPAQIDEKNEPRIKIDAEMKHVLDVLNIEEETRISVQPFSAEQLTEFYNNEQLKQVAEFTETYFTRIEPPPSELYSLLTEYIQLHRSSEENKDTLSSLLSEIERNVERVWTVWPDIMLTERGKCADKKELIFYHSYQGARLNTDALEAYEILLTRIRTFVCDEKIVNDVNLRVCELRIEGILADIANSCSDFDSLEPSAPLTLSCNIRDSYVTDCISRLYTAIEVLFHFCRKTTDSTFNEDLVDQLRQWLSNMVAILVRIGAWRDHMFVFNHVLRCPDSMAVWAARFIQCPADAADHAVALLSVLLQPVAQRDAFLVDSQKGDSWIIVDSDGEGNDCPPDCLKEDTLIAVFNQIPLAQIIKKYIREKPSEYPLLRLLAFLQKLLDVLHVGLQQYNQPEHKQFIKMLGKLVKQLTALATKQIEVFSSKSAVTERLQVEYDAFILKAADCILTSETNWQCLAVISVQLISDSAKWRLFLALQLIGTVSLSDFERRFESLHEADQIYLLSAISNLVLGAESVPVKLIQCVTLQIFYIGFISEFTRESSYKSAKSLLASLCLKHNYLMSELLSVQDEYFENAETEDQSLTICLWMDFPIIKWCPSEQNFEILCKWLLAPPCSSKNELGRCILKSIDYKQVSWELQKKVTYNVIAAHVQNKSDASFAQWTWVCLAQLRLHLADRYTSIADVESSLYLVPEYAASADLNMAVAQQEPVSVYLALSTTLVGHSAPLIFYQGFSLLKVLMAAKQYEAVFLCLKNMTVMFWSNPKSLFTCEPFLSILADITTVDNAYLKMAKGLIYNEGPGPILRKFSAMLHHQLRYAESGYLCKAVTLWFGSLCKLPLWHYNASVLYLLDIVCRHAFFDAAAWQSVLDILESSLTTLAPSQPKSPLSSLITWIGSSSEATLLPQGCSGDAPWFAYAALSVEFDVFERRTTLWTSFLQESYDRLQVKSSISGCLKKVCNSLQLPQRSFTSLAIHRWASQILATPTSHPICPLIWQKFMELYFARVPGLADRGSLGAALFTGNKCSGVLKNLQAHLDTSNKKDPQLFYTTMSYWLSEPTLLEPRLLVAALPPHYQPGLLNSIFVGDTRPWFQFFDSQRFLVDLGKDSDMWLALLARNKVVIPPLPQPKLPPPFSQLLTAVKEMAVCSQPPPELKTNWVPPVKLTVIKGIPKCPFSLNDLRKHSSLFNQRDMNAVKAEERLLSCLRSLYACTKCSVSLSNTCDGFKDKEGRFRSCSGSASLTFKFEEWKIDSKISKYKNEAAEQFCDFVTQDYDSHVHLLVYAVRLMVSCFLREIKEQRLLSQRSEPQTEAAVKFFFDLLQHCTDEVHFCPSLRKQLTESLQALGEVCIAGNAANTSRFYEETYNNRFAFDLKNVLFTPHVLDPATFVKYYRMAVMAAKTAKDVSVVPSFDIGRWLEQQTPRLMFRSELLNHLFNGLKRFPQDEDGAFSRILNEQLASLVLYDFPEHYGEVLQHLISVGQAKPWLTFINALCPPTLKLPYNNGKLNLKNVSNFINKFAVEQRCLTAKDLQETSLWGSLTLKERCMYSKFSRCAELLLVFLGMMVQSYVIQLIHTSPGALSSQLVDQVWQVLDRLFIPWLTPLRTDQSLVQPFTAEQERLASFCVTIFTESIRFTDESLSATEAVLSCSWRWYTTNFCDKDVSPFVLNTVHDSLATLPWLKFHPTLHDVELMLKVVNEYLPTCHSFVGNVFVSIDWNAVVTRSRSNDRMETSTQLFVCLLHLLVKVPSEPSLKMNRAVQLHLSNAMSYPWYMVDATNYQSVMTWLSATCPPSVVLDDPASDYREVDTLVLRLLQTAAGFHSCVQFFHQTTPLKRQFYVATVVKCLATEHSKRKKGLSAQLIKRTVANLLNDIETVTVATVPEERRVYDVGLLLDAVLKLLTETSLCSAVEETIVEVISAGQSPLLLQGLLRTCGVRVPNPVIYGSIIECCIETHFTFGGYRDWQLLASSIAPHSSVSSNVSILISNSFLLTLHAAILNRTTSEAHSPRTLINTLLHMFATFKPSEESEPKLMLLVGLTLQLAQQQPDAASLLCTLSDSLANISNDRAAGLLSTLGIKRNASPTYRLKATCLVACAGISSLLVSRHSHPSDDRYSSALDKIETNKAFQPIVAHLLAVRPALRDLKDVRELVVLLYSLGAQVFGRLYLF